MTKSIVTLLRVAFARLRFVSVFLISALVIGYWDNIKNHVDHWTRPAVAPDELIHAAASSVEFFCPMHPDVIREEAGVCPRCGMPLVKRKKGEKLRLPDDVLARVQLTPQRIALANIHTTAVEYRPLVRNVRAVGVLDYDETRLARLSARVAGRADELFATYTGQSVSQGDPLYSLYSPDVYTAQREYLLARKRAADLPKDTSDDSRADSTAVYNASLQKLVLWGISNQQLDKLDEEYDRTSKVPTNLVVTSPIAGIIVRKDLQPGQYVQMGDAPYTVADLHSLWLQLKLYERDVPLVKIGDAVDVIVDAMSDEKFRGFVAFKSFQLDPQTRTLDARVVVENAALHLRPGMFATAKIRVPITNSTFASEDTAMPATAPSSTPTEMANTFAAALTPYLAAQKQLAADKAEGVAARLAESVDFLKALKGVESMKPAYARLADAVDKTKSQPLAELRNSFKDVSAALIEIGRQTGLPASQSAIKIFRCPMKNANWLQLGDQTQNPYYGSEMLACGTATDTFPIANIATPAIRAAAATNTTAPADRMLAIPRSAVIDTGEKQIVYVESSPGAYDMRSVKLGPLAGDDYPALDGVSEGDRVVTIGTFLVDAENRLNPSK